jgi:hypothetical protein
LHFLFSPSQKSHLYFPLFLSIMYNISGKLQDNRLMCAGLWHCNYLRNSLSMGNCASTEKEMSVMLFKCHKS